MTGQPLQPPTSRAGRNLPAAIGVGVGLFSVAALTLMFAPGGFVLFVAVLLCLAVKEVHDALLRKGMRAELIPIMIGTGLSVLGGYVVAYQDLGIEGITFIAVCLVATMLASLAARLRGGAEGYLRDSAASALLIAYLPLNGVFVALMMGATDGNLRIVAVVACVVAGDIGAYATGVLFGKHKLAPSISPSKTWEGLFGALIFASGIGVVAMVFLLGGPWWLGLLLGFFGAAAGTLGDLVESLIKRDAGLKDMSNFLPGHGGVMDRLDSLLMAFPVGWFILHFGLGA